MSVGGMPTHRIRMLQELMRSRQPQDMAMRAPDAPPVAQLEVDFPEVDRPMPPMDMPTEEQVNAPVYYKDGPVPFGPDAPTFEAPAPPTSMQRRASALQKHRANIAARQSYGG